MTILPDLQAFDIHLHNLDGPLPQTAVRGHALNGLFYAEMGRRRPALVDELHRPGNRNQRKPPRPFSLSPLENGGNFLGLRIGSLTQEFGESIAEVWGALSARGQEVQLGSARMVVERIKPGRPMGMFYQELWENSEPAHGVELKFITPTRIKWHGHDGVMPIPAAVWQNYAQRWEAFSGLELPPEFKRWVEFQVHAVSVDLKIESAYVEMTVGWKGVTGKVSYQAFGGDKNIPQTREADYLRAWQALALLSEFCGTGEKVTMGMGRTQKISNFGPHKIKELPETG